MSDALTDNRSQHEAWEVPHKDYFNPSKSKEAEARTEPRPSWSAGTVLSEAASLVSSDRARQHGNKINNHQNIAALWSAYLGYSVTSDQVAIMMVLLKIARTKTGALNRDDYLDMAGYAGVAAEIVGVINGQH